MTEGVALHKPARGKSVRLEQVSKSYGAAQVLRDFSLEVPAGSFCTLLGASGSGKTTLLKLIAGFEALDGGSIHIGERDVGHVPVAKRNIGMVFQNYALFPHMSVAANIAFGLEMRRLARAEVRRRMSEALALVGLQEFGDRYPRQLSGGQQQRVALARALVISPDILLMDEPLGALDKNLRQGLQLQIKELQARLGVTIIFVTHDQEEALNLSDRIVVLNKGRIEQEGTPKELYLRPVNRFVASFLGECNCLEVEGRSHGVRPEKLRIGPAADCATYRLEGVVTDVTFLGNAIRIGVRHRDARIVASVPVDDLSGATVPGQTVQLGYAASDAMMFRD
ncbi:putative spermidine/putrescine transport system ATP-binding protein/spermidine/putrescine transport system ATP-binding protein [Rhizobiales bacterium GAS191]|nr:putative spermidine/putrescine transport system ATP-binding protein/spermidine/putrescine transport system ATP-binding protein [Rhizobiales bacterium GAS191]